MRLRIRETLVTGVSRADKRSQSVVVCVDPFSSGPERDCLAPPTKAVIRGPLRQGGEIGLAR